MALFRSSRSNNSPLGRLFLLFAVLCSQSSSVAAELSSVALNEDSVVLITGAAGFIGSELSMALHRTYNVSKLILMDSLENIKPGGIPAQHRKHPNTAGHRSEADLALLEFRRQRIFHVLQVCGNKAHFYRTDMRPTIPEYFDQGEVAVLDLVFRQHEDITHIVHLADPYHRANIEAQEVQDTIDNVLRTQAVPRSELEMKSGMMEAVLEQIRLHYNTTHRMPHLVYASSADVYHHTPGKTPQTMFERPNPPPFSEAKPITTPSNLAGASKLLDEILAQTYYELEDITSVGLRYFSVYGPWGMPGSPVYEMADRAANGQPILSENERNIVDHLKDFVYIDDAIDATMAAMQFRAQPVENRPPPPVVVNVGTGQPLSLRQLAKRLNAINPKAKMQGPPDELEMRDRQHRSYAGTERATELLGFTARVDVEQGLAQTIAWHYDRAFPYGNKEESKMSKTGIASCNRFDEECLKGVPVFPCASECAHPQVCMPSLLDDVVGFTRMLTEQCDVVMYTVDLDDNLQAIPSSQVQVSKKSQSHVTGGNGSFCNLAFVSETSPLVQNLKRQGIGQVFPATGEPVLMNGFWALVPLTISSYAKEQLHIWSLTPKLSPTNFFHPNVKLGIYADPNVIFDSIPTLMEEASMQPSHPKIKGATALMIGKPRKSTLQSEPVYKTRNPRESVQEQAYRMLRMTLHDEMSADGFSQKVDPSFMVHAFHEDARLLRCDIFGEVVQWDVAQDQASVEFILGVHDMWSNVIARKGGDDPWWHGEKVETVPSGAYVTSEKVTTEKEGPNSEHRRLEEKEEAPKKEVKEEAPKPKEAKEEVPKPKEVKEEAPKPDEVKEEEPEPNEFGHDGTDVTGSEDDSEDEESEEEEDVDAAVEEANQEEEAKPPEQKVFNEEDYDTSSYDNWLGVLSSGATRYFARIVNWDAVGAVHLEDYQYTVE